jgi:hypothetical protein
MNTLKYHGIYVFFALLGIFLLFLFGQCATVGRPTGGDRDSIAPVIVMANPPLNTVNFDARNIEIQFDEYVQIKNADKELIISPPFEKKPMVRIKGKGILMELDGKELKDSTTYIFNFGDAIVDLNESNPFSNLTYVFSTGPVIDSFGISGQLVNAFDLQPPKSPYWVMLYDNTWDSIPLKERPIYVARTSKEDGSYSIEHVKPGTYRLFALQENGGNFIYDRPDEFIAFSDSLIHFDPEFFRGRAHSDTLADTLAVAQDSINPQALASEHKIYGFYHNLFAFQEPGTDTLQYMKKPGLIDNRMLYFAFNNAVTDSFDVWLKYFPDKNDWYLKEMSPGRDSINYWITDSALLSADTLSVVVQYVKHDSLKQLVPQLDTIKHRFFKPAIPGNRKKGKDENDGPVKPEPLQLDINIANNSRMELNDSLTIHTIAPIAKIDTSRILFQEMVDTLFIRREYNIVRDGHWANKTLFDFGLKEDTRFKLTLFDSAYTDIYGKANDTTIISFATKRQDQYAILHMEVTQVLGLVIVQLMDKNEKVVREKILASNGKLTFEYIKPGEYKMKAIYDRNRNGKWDPGIYLKNILPEKVEYYPKGLKLRENWEHVEQWELQKPDHGQSEE